MTPLEVALFLVVWSLLGAAPLITGQRGRPTLEIDARQPGIKLYLLVAGPLVWAALAALWLWGDS